MANQGERIADGGPRRHGHHMVDVRVALEDVLGVAEHQHVERRPRKSPPHGANEWRGEQHIAEAAQRDHEDARALGQLKARHRNVPRRGKIRSWFCSQSDSGTPGLLLKKAPPEYSDPSARRARSAPKHLPAGYLGAHVFPSAFAAASAACNIIPPVRPTPKT